MLNKYGHNIYGFKNDRICNLLSPVYIVNNIPQFSLVMAYDIVYDSNLIKEEINFISKIIDLIKITDKEKIELLTRILSYWNLSIKDKKWNYENERRYEIRIYDDYNYVDSFMTNSFLKVNSTLYLLPDFINKSNLMFNRIKNERINKLRCILTKEYLFCEECLQADYDYYEKHTKCKICGSEKISIIKK